MAACAIYRDTDNLSQTLHKCHTYLVVLGAAALSGLGAAAVAGLDGGAVFRPGGEKDGGAMKGKDGG